MTMERIKFATFIAFIALCFGVGFYAGEAVASISVAKAHAANGQAYVYMEVIENGKVVNKVSEVRSVEGGSVSVVVKDSKVEVNGVEVSQKGSDGKDGATGRAGLNTVVFVTTGSGADGEDGKDGIDGADGSPGAASAQAVSVAGTVSSVATSTATTTVRSLSELTSVYSLINSLVAYVATVLTR